MVEGKKKTRLVVDALWDVRFVDNSGLVHREDGRPVSSQSVRRLAKCTVRSCGNQQCRLIYVVDELVHIDTEGIVKSRVRSFGQMVGVSACIPPYPQPRRIHGQ